MGSADVAEKAPHPDNCLALLQRLWAPHEQLLQCTWWRANRDLSRAERQRKWQAPFQLILLNPLKHIGVLSLADSSCICLIFRAQPFPFPFSLLSSGIDKVWLHLYLFEISHFTCFPALSLLSLFASLSLVW